MRVTQTVAPGSVFVPFHFNTELVNTLTQPLFDPKSGEPNFKQTAIQLHSEKVPEGISIKVPEHSGSITHQESELHHEAIQEHAGYVKR